MSAKGLNQVIAKAITDLKYRELLFSSPDEALAGYDLTKEETAALKTLDRSTFDAVAKEVEMRVSEAGIEFTAVAILCNSVVSGGWATVLNLSDLIKRLPP